MHKEGFRREEKRKEKVDEIPSSGGAMGGSHWVGTLL